MDDDSQPALAGEFRIGILTRQYASAVRFYQSFLGLSITDSWNRGAGDVGALFRHGSTVVELYEVPDGVELPRPAGTWLYLEVNSVDAFARRAEQHGVEVILTPRDEPWGHRRMKVRDPSGIEVGLFERTHPRTPRSGARE